MGGVLQSDPVTTRKNLIRYLRHLTANVWPEYEHELVLPQEAERLLREAHVAALRYIGIQLQSDPVAREFVETIDRSIPGPPYDRDDTLSAARRLAPRFLRRLEKERDAEQDEAKRDLVGKTRRDFLKSRAEVDPFCSEANLAVDGLLEIPKTEVRINAMDGSVINEF